MFSRQPNTSTITPSKLPKNPITTNTNTSNPTAAAAAAGQQTASRFASLLSSPSNTAAALQQQHTGSKPPLFSNTTNYASSNNNNGGSVGGARLRQPGGDAINSSAQQQAYTIAKPLQRTPVNTNVNPIQPTINTGAGNGFSHIRPLSNESRYTRGFNASAQRSPSSADELLNNSNNGAAVTVPMHNWSAHVQQQNVDLTKSSTVAPAGTKPRSAHQKVSDAWSHSPQLSSQQLMPDAVPDALSSWESLAHDYVNDGAGVGGSAYVSEPNTANSDAPQYSITSEASTPLLHAAQPSEPLSAHTPTVTAHSNNHASAADVDSDDDDKFMRHISRKQLDALTSVNEPIINSLYVLYDTPVEGVELKPYVSITDQQGTLCTLESLERMNITNVKCEFLWQHSDRRLCNNTAINCTNAAKLQCMQCVKLELNDQTSYYCSNTCMQQAWQQHKELHSKTKTVNANNNRRGQQQQRSTTTQQPMQHSLEWTDDDGDVTYDSTGLTVQQSAKLLHCRFPAPCINNWTTVGQSRIYAPTKIDVGRVIRISCWPSYIDAANGNDSNGAEPVFKQGKMTTIETHACLAIPSAAPPRHLSYNSSLHQRNPVNPFRVICYNTLAPIYATASIYPYTPLWALTWDYRKNLLLREILNYNADIICLQEVQTEHFHNFFQPQLSAVGYDGCFKAKTRDAPAWSIDTSTPGGAGSPSIDGCATFYRRDRFMLTEKHEIEFNEVVKRSGFTDKRVLRRLCKGNIALAVVLEELQEPTIVAGLQRRQKKRRLCVTNTHIYWDPEFADVKLWQTWALTTELEKIVLGRGLPLVLMGDYNSYPESSVYELLTAARVNVQGGDAQQAIQNANMANVTNNYLPTDLRAVHHRLPLVSAYASCDSNGMEPAYTNYTGHFVGTLDYIFYTPQQLQLLTCLDVDDESIVSAQTALPNSTHPSDHIALVADLDFKLQM